MCQRCVFQMHHAEADPESPWIVGQMSNMLLVWKPPKWEVDTEDVGFMNRLVPWLQDMLWEVPDALPHNGGYEFGFIHRLDT